MATLNIVQADAASAFISGREVGRYVVVRRGQEEWDDYATRDEAIEAAFTSVAWPGGYVVTYYLEDGTVLCGGCAAAEYRGSGTAAEGHVEEESSYDIVCDGCNGLILEQNLCTYHGVDQVTGCDDCAIAARNWAA